MTDDDQCNNKEENASTGKEGQRVTKENSKQHDSAPQETSSDVQEEAEQQTKTGNETQRMSEEATKKSTTRGKIVSGDGVERTQWYDEREDEEEAEATTDETGNDVTMTEATQRASTMDDTPREQHTSNDKGVVLEEGEIQEDEFGQFNDEDIMGIDTGAFEKTPASGGTTLFTSHPTDGSNKSEGERRREKMQRETAEYMKMKPSKRDGEKAINIWVLVNVPNGNIEKYKTTMWHDVIHELFEADPEIKILPRRRTSNQQPFGAGEGKIPPMLFPDYITPPRINKTYREGAIRYEFSFRIQQGLYIYRDLRQTQEIKNVLQYYNMEWFPSAIDGSSRTRLGFIYGKAPDYSYISHYAAWLRKQVPRETPPFDLRVEPQTYHYGATHGKPTVVKVFAASEDTDQVIAGVMSIIGDMNSTIFFVPRILSDDLQAKFLHQHTQVQSTMTRMDVPSHHLDRPTKISGQMWTIRDYVLQLKDPTGAPCRLDIEKLSSKSQSKGKKRAFMPTILLIPKDCPSPNWSKKHVLEMLTKIKYPGSALRDNFQRAHKIPQEMEAKFQARAAQVPEPKQTYRGATAKTLNTSGNSTQHSWASRVRKGTSQGATKPTSQPSNVPPPYRQAPLDDMTAKLEEMAKEQNAMKVRAANTGITIKAHTDAMDTLKKSVAAQDAAMKKTETNVGQVFSILHQSQTTQRAFQQKLDTLSGLSVLMYKVLRKQFPKEQHLHTGCDPLVEALAANLHEDSIHLNLEEQFLAEDEAAAMEGVTDDMTIATVGTGLSAAGYSDSEYDDELGQLDEELAKVSAEASAIQQQQRELEEWSEVPSSPRRRTPRSPPQTARTSTGVRLERSPGHNRYAELGASHKKKRSGSKSKDDDPQRE